MLLYERVAHQIAEQIKAGTLKRGEKIPSVRRMSQSCGVSKSTVIQAYLHLEKLQLIEARPQSGFFVRGVEIGGGKQQEKFAFRELPLLSSAPPRLSIAELHAPLMESARDRSIVPLGAACPSPELFPSQSLNRLMRSILRRHPLHSSRYDYPPGNEKFLLQIARRATSWGGNMTHLDVVATSGAMEAIHLALRAVTKPGDVILVESPTYFGILETLESLRLRVVEVPCHAQDGLEIEAVETVIATEPIKAAVVIANFNNPFGSLMPEATRKKFAALMISRRIPIIEVDVFGDLYFSGKRPRNIKSFDDDGWIILCSSFSKTLSPGFRIGWIAPGRFKAEVMRLKYMSSTATPSLAQRTIAEYISSGEYDRHLRRLSKAFAEQMQRARETVIRSFPQGTVVSNPGGGFVLWVELPTETDSLALFQSAVREKISISPGPLFSVTGRFRNCIRLNCGNVWSERIETAIETVGKLARK